MTDRSIKSIRLSNDTQRLLKLVSAYEDKTEGAIVEEALAVYLQVRSLAYSNTLDAARHVAHSTPETAGDVVERLTAAIAEALESARVGKARFPHVLLEHEGRRFTTATVFLRKSLQP